MPEFALPSGNLIAVDLVNGGFGYKIPPQVQLDIAARKKIIVDEHSGRILVDALLAEEQGTKMKRKLAKVLKAS